MFRYEEVKPQRDREREIDKKEKRKCVCVCVCVWCSSCCGVVGVGNGYGDK